MTSSHKNSKKLTWCLSTYGKILEENGFKIRGVRDCYWGDNCNNAHDVSEISLSPEISKWNKKSKENVDLLKIKNNIIRVINVDKEKVKNPKYISQIQHISDLNFKSLLDFWFDITCYHRKIDKDIKRDNKGTEGYYKSYDVPKFYLEDEDDVWSLQRTLNICKSHKYLIENKKEVHYIKDICVGHHNCKKGVHKIKDLACIDDLIKGECNCKPEEQINIEKEKYIIERDNILDILYGTEDEEFTLILSKTKEKQYKQRLDDIDKILQNIGSRMIHYTEQGMIPLNKRIEEHKSLEPQNIEMKLNKKKVLRLVK